MECLDTRFPMPTLVCAGHSVKKNLINLIYIYFYIYVLLYIRQEIKSFFSYPVLLLDTLNQILVRTVLLVSEFSLAYNFRYVTTLAINIDIR